ncbi:unnamed protein product [Cuscuta epithymum]|uniref:SWIM-type domain-containing protein n=1 Tax=Cuscuta epithymum TaxID=186058 RepID=A0AAV0EIP6_9ASTE|nr:unnamed protein product [Cuscuta epithymum]
MEERKQQGPGQPYGIGLRENRANTLQRWFRRRASCCSMVEENFNPRKRSNPGSKAEIELCSAALKEGKRIFKRMLICFATLKLNWLAGCRRIIGVDGSFLKGVCKGILLSAVGVDGDGQMVPIAWAVTDKENKSNWRWFLTWLVQEPDLKTGSYLTLISYMQKRLIIAAQDVIPDEEHRFCARHVYANWSKKWRGDQLCKKFWICAWNTYEEELQNNLKRLGKLSNEAASDVLKHPFQTWCMAYFSSQSKCWMVDNNIIESFNAWIREARAKPIVSMLEVIRLKAMKRLSDFKGSHEKWINDWSPTCMEYYQANKEAVTGCNTIFNGDVGFEIGEGEDKHTVMLDKLICTCRAWELAGIPCLHALCALYYKKEDALSYISRWYHKETYMAAYQYPLQPIPGKAFMKVDEYEPILPPPVPNLLGRPKKNRVRGSNEVKGPGSGSKVVDSTSSHRASRKGQIQTCGICHLEGHKRAKCPNKDRPVTNESREQPTPATLSTQPATNESREQGTPACVSTPDGVNQRKRPASVEESTDNRKGKSKLPCRRMARSKGKQPVTGFGCYVDVNTRSKTINPGMDSEELVSEFNHEVAHDPDVNVRFVIPNEKEIRSPDKFEKDIDVPAYRTISFKGDEAQVRIPTNLIAL